MTTPSKENAKPIFKTPAGISVLKKMLQGGTPDEILARMTATDQQTLAEMRSTVSPELKRHK